jgi:6-phosphogluconolactonase
MENTMHAEKKSEVVLDYGDRGQVVVVRDANALADVAATLIAKTSVKAVDESRQVYIALSGGSTPKAMGALLAQPPFVSEVHWDRLTFFWGDERWVPISSPDSNAGEANRTFLDAVPVLPENVVPFDTEDVTPAESATKLEAIIRDLVPGKPVPEFDLILLGMGDDGHTASLFPGTDAIQEHHKLVIAHEVEKLKSTRLTFTPALINAAKHVVFLVSGAAKAEVLAEVLDGGIDVDRLPSQVIRPANGTLTWMVDRDAAAELERYDENA